jgi:DNA-binding NarL/FixJ family response regulator
MRWMSAGENPIRILTVDDHSLFRNGIAALLATQPDMTLVAEASNGPKKPTTPLSKTAPSGKRLQ